MITSCRSNAMIFGLLSAIQTATSFNTAFHHHVNLPSPFASPTSSTHNTPFLHTTLPPLTAHHPLPKLQMFPFFGNTNDDDEGTESSDSESDYSPDYDPLEEGVDSISWLPPLDPSSPTSPSKITTSSTPESSILPLFPLGGIVYTPNSEHVLNIFEPRYRQMYNDILMNGTKRFVVAMSHPEVQGTFAKVGVVFQLEDLKEVSEQTEDQIKYVCNHKVVGRVLINRVLNPEVWDTRETYLKVEGLVIDETDGEADKEKEIDEDDDEDEDKSEKKKNVDEAISKAAYATLLTALSKSRKPTPPLSDKELRLKESFKALVEKQHKLEEDIRFTTASIASLAVAPGGGSGSLWMTVRLWQNFIEQRLVGRQNEMQMEFQKKLIAFLKKEKGLGDNELPSAIGFDDLSPSLQQEVKDLQKRMQSELKPLVLESTLTIQKILECEDHGERVDLLRYFVQAEKRRLDAKATLKGMFLGSPDAIATDFVEKDAEEEGKEAGGGDEAENLKEMMNLDGDVGDTKGSLFTDDEDAFQ